MSSRFSYISNAIIAVLLCLPIGCETGQNSAPVAEDRSTYTDSMANTPFWSEGIENPQFVTVQDSKLPSETEIIGVVIDTEAFAFPLNMMAGMQDHVVNHVVVHGDRQVPLSATYCDVSDCIRVLSSSDVTESLKISTVGRSHGELLLQYGEHRFLQNTPQIPLDDVPFERTTLHNWVASHPDSKIYLGRKESS